MEAMEADEHLRLGLFGGSFDPVHLGHLLVAQAAREELALTRLFFIPAAQSPFKPENQPTPPGDRVRLLRLALAGESWCEIDEQEIQRGGVSYTIETLSAYARRYPSAKLFYLIGSDHVPLLPKWREAEKLAQLAEFVVIPRPGATQLKSQALPGPAAGGGPLSEPPGFHLRHLNGFPLGVSSSQIRDRVKKGLGIRHLVPAAVAEAVRNYRLYL